MANEKILIVDDELAINKLVASCLQKERFETCSAFDGKEAMEALREFRPDLIILDIMLPDVDGTQLCLDIRKITDAPIIFLSAKTQEIDKIIALSTGGDDYITKPFMTGELTARVKAHLRRQSHNRAERAAVSASNVYVIDDLKMDFDTYEIYRGEEEIRLTRKECEILRLLVENPRKMFSAIQIFETVWKSIAMESDARTVMVYISNLRKKIEPDSNNPRYITTIRGVGYKFNQRVKRK